MTYRDNTPNFNTKRISNFEDFAKQKSDLEEVKRKSVKNNPESKNIPGDKTIVYNHMTKKMDTVTPKEINDFIDDENEE